MAFLNYLSYYLPSKILTNQDLVNDFNDWSSDKIFLKTGILKRHVVENETVVDLAVCASDKLFNDYKIDKQIIDFVILATQTPDYLLPTSACIVQDRLSLGKNVGALDINLGCSAYIYGLALANSLVQSSVARNVLLITSETYSKHIHKKDKSVRTIFGDGASASIISNVPNGLTAKIDLFSLGTDGSGWNKLIIPTGGGAQPKTDETSKEYTDGEYIRSKDNLYMDGASIMAFSIDVVPKSIKETLKKAGLRMEDLDYFIFHQASIFILNYFRRTLNISDDKFIIEIQDIGNTVSSTIPIALSRAISSGKIHKGNKVLIVGFGVGLSWGSTILYF